MISIFKKLSFVLILLIIEIFFIQNAIAKPNANDDGNEYYDQDEDEDFVPVNPCSVVRPGDPDLTTYDIISSYGFEEYEYQGVQQIVGSTGYQQAYHISEYSNMTIESSRAFPKGVPTEFSFECTFRVPQQQPLYEWHLFELSNYEYESQMSVTINPAVNAIEFSVPKYDGTIQTVSFEETEIFDRSWHKVMLGVSQDGVRLWVDCKPVPDASGSLKAPLDVLGPVDATEGAFSVAKTCLTKETVPIDLQWMIFSCDKDKPDHTSCEDIPQYAKSPKGMIKFESTTTVPTTATRSTSLAEDTTPNSVDLKFLHSSTQQPWLVDTTPSYLIGNDLLACPEQCPRGPPGIPGAPGLRGLPGAPGLMGVPGTPASTFGRYASENGNGQKGEPGLMGPAGERGLSGQRGVAGLPGPQGPPGFGTRGLTGENGLPGEKGERGLPGLDGANGEPGPMGPPGPPGPTSEHFSPDTTQRFNNIGVPGPRGDAGLPGFPGPPGPPGPPGYTTITENRNIEEREIREICMAVVREYISEISSTLVGPPGPPGRRGVGRQGPRGPQGLQGEQGLRGVQGERGYPGMPGMPGSAGNLGPRGPEGEKGDRGEPGVGREGPMGPMGLTGAEGRGIDGMPGMPGARGETGRPGETGTRGPPGEPCVCSDSAAYQAAYAYPLLMAQQQQNNKGPQNYYNKGPIY